MLDTTSQVELLTPSEFISELMVSVEQAELLGIRNPVFVASDINLMLLTAWDGKPVSLIIDARNTIERAINPTNNELLEQLINSNSVKYRSLYPLSNSIPYPFRRDHTKLCYTADKNGNFVGYFGGYNFGPSDWVNRHDYMLKFTDIESAELIAGLTEHPDFHNFDSDFYFETPAGIFYMDTGGIGRSLIYDQILKMVGNAPKNSEIVCISPWSSGVQLSKALSTAKENGCNVTYLTNVPPLKLDAYSVYNLPKFASLMIGNKDVVNVKTEIHGKLVAVIKDGRIVDVICTGHCLNDYQNWCGTIDLAVRLKQPNIAGVFDYIQRVKSDV